MTELPVTQEMVILCAFLRIFLRTASKRERRRILHEMSVFMAELAGSEAWSAHVLLDTKVDEARLAVRTSAAAHWAIIRRAVERDVG